MKEYKPLNPIILLYLDSFPKVSPDSDDFYDFWVDLNELGAYYTGLLDKRNPGKIDLNELNKSKDRIKQINIPQNEIHIFNQSILYLDKLEKAIIENNKNI